jgi:hypothetical protein
MNDLNWVVCQSTEDRAMSLDIAGASVSVPALGQLGKQEPMACFVDEETLAGVDRLGWLNLWDSSTGQSLVRTDPLLHPIRFETDLKVVIAGGWVLGVNSKQRRLQGFRFPHGDAGKVGHPCTQSHKQAMLSTRRDRLWLIDLVTLEIEEVRVQMEVTKWDEEQGVWNRILQDVVDLPIGINGVTFIQNHLSVICTDFSGDGGDGDPSAVTVYDWKESKWICQKHFGCRDFLIQRPGYRNQFVFVCGGRSVIFRRCSLNSSFKRMLFELTNVNSEVISMAISSNGCTLAALMRNLSKGQVGRNEVLIIDIVHRKLAHRSTLPTTEPCWRDCHIEFAPSNQQITICGWPEIYISKIGQSLV